MTTFDEIVQLKTPEEVAEALGPHIKAGTVRRHAVQGTCTYTRGPRGKVLFSAADVESLLAALRVPVSAAPEEGADVADVFRTTSRSAARGQNVA